MRRFMPLSASDKAPEAPTRELDIEIDARLENDTPKVKVKRKPEPRIKRRARSLAKNGPVGRIVVPKALVRDVLNVYHGIPLTGHFGKDKTVQNIETHFYWQGLTKDVHDRVQGCHLCQMRKQTRVTDWLVPDFSD